MPFEWALGALEHLPEGIEPYEVMQVLSSTRPRFPVPAWSQGVHTLTIWGRADSGRALVVACVKRNGLDYDIAGARELHGHECDLLEKWEETRRDEQG
ncbi:hypothetical protein [Glycomyces paridis]|uniref:Uncharacterized protein n=1 Tax=Glycomyces paridis TaxID=2126555 RepID=A0A4S8P8U5_9ACTN|nr:hypothetical protein [Glycomyces paridis]THV24269.1 hypothetical protein E9998_21845 [Glycomyces paridis]